MVEKVDNMERDLSSNEGVKDNKRERMAKLNLQLARLVCRHCNSKGCWKITKTGKVVRYIKCNACGRTSALSTNTDATKTLRESDLEKMR